MGALDGLTTPDLPLADPYAVRAAFAADGTSHVEGNAPDTATADALEAAFAQAAGAAPQTRAWTLARGMPSDDWPTLVSEFMALAAPLDRWSLSLTGTQAAITGLAPNGATRDAVVRDLAAWSGQSGLGLSRDIAAGPETLDPAIVAGELDSLSTCGPLALLDPPDSYALFDTVAVSGDLAAAEDRDRVTDRLAPLIGDRDLKLDATILNDDLCAIRAVLPPAPDSAVSIWLGKGGTGEASLTGVFRTGENPVADVLIPAGIADGSLWVMVVDNTGKVFHILPNINRTDHDIASLGTVEDGLRRIRTLWSRDQLPEDPNRLAMEVTEGDYGKSEVVAILSRGPLFDMRRPRDESVQSVAKALAEAVADGRTEILGMASRIIDARP